MNTIVYTLTMSLFDSLSTTQQIIIFVLMLTTLKPLRNALSFLVGLSGAYFVCGMGGYLALDQLRAFIGKFFPSSVNMSNPLYYQTEFLTGAVMAAIGFWYFFKKKQVKPGRTENMIVARLKSMNAVFAFGVGVFISVTSFPMSVPYILALGKYATLHIGLTGATGYILLYNIGYAFPMLLITAVYLIARRGADDFHDTLHEKAKMLNVHLTTWTFVGFGAFSMVDASCYFAFGNALVKGRYF